MRIEAVAVNRDFGSPIGGRLRYVARQAILDARGRIHGYNLLFRREAGRIPSDDQEEATRAMLDQTVLYGLDRLTGGLPAFVACTEQTLTHYLVEVMLPSMTVLDLQITEPPKLELISVVRLLKAAGFRLALSGFWWETGTKELIALADFLKVDFTLLAEVKGDFLHDYLSQATATLVAANVETHEAFRRAQKNGFTLFQGYYFCHPELLKNRTIPANRLAQIRLLDALLSPAIDLHELSALVKRDTSIGYRLLRLVNSPLFAIRQEVRSIESALMLVGQDTFQRIVVLALASEFNSGGSPIVLLLTLVRARFCEQAAGLNQLQPAEQYMLGMLSLMPVMLRVTMNDLTPELPVRMAIREALLGNENNERVLLSWLESYEQGNWEECDFKEETHHLNGQELSEIYTNAVCWAETVTKSVR
jgi:EAL and modified HD-GYP domain-containing signal transduction protein